MVSRLGFGGGASLLPCCGPVHCCFCGPCFRGWVCKRPSNGNKSVVLFLLPSSLLLWLHGDAVSLSFSEALATCSSFHRPRPSIRVILALGDSSDSSPNPFSESSYQVSLSLRRYVAASLTMGGSVCLGKMFPGSRPPLLILMAPRPFQPRGPMALLSLLRRCRPLRRPLWPRRGPPRLPRHQVPQTVHLGHRRGRGMGTRRLRFPDRVHAE